MAQYKYELHLHSYPSSKCGKSCVIDLIDAAISEGYQGAVLTNHFYTGNTGIDRELPWEKFVSQYENEYLKGKAYADTVDFDFLFGVEHKYCKDAKEALIYGITPEVFRQYPCFMESSLTEQARAVHENGGMIFYAHPFRSRAYISNADVEPDLSPVDGFEVFNGGNTPEQNEKAAEFAAKTGARVIAGGDVHSIKGKENFCGITVSERIKTNEDLIKILRSGDYSLITH